MMLTISTEHNEARLGGTLAFLDAGAGAARIRIYDGIRPATNNGTITDQVLLVELPLDKPSGTLAAGVLSLAASTLPLIVNTGQASWARIVNGDGVQAIDCDVSDETGSAPIKLQTTTLYAGGRAVLTSGTLG